MNNKSEKAPNSSPSWLSTTRRNFIQVYTQNFSFYHFHLVPFLQLWLEMMSWLAVNSLYGQKANGHIISRRIKQRN